MKKLQRSKSVINWRADGVEQQLFSNQISAAVAETRLTNDPENTRSALGDVLRNAMEALVEMKALLQQLSPAPLEKSGWHKPRENSVKRSNFALAPKLFATWVHCRRMRRIPISNYSRSVKQYRPPTGASHVPVRFSGDEREQQLELDIRDNVQDFYLNHATYVRGISRACAQIQ